MTKLKAYAVVDITDAPEVKVEVVYTSKERAEHFRDKQIKYYGPLTVINLQEVEVIVEHLSDNPSCVCHIDNGLVQEWVAKARSIARGMWLL